MGPDDLPPIHGLEELRQTQVDLRPGDRFALPMMLAAGVADLIRITVQWKDEAGVQQETFAVQMP